MLPIDHPERTSPVIDRFSIPRPASPPSKRELKRTRAARNKAKKATAPPVVPQTLKRVMSWQEEIDSGDETRASISRREELTRARVTQLMKLLELPNEVRQAMLSSPENYRDWTIRRALTETMAKASS